jgi:fused signal recognition particle receptor
MDKLLPIVTPLFQTVGIAEPGPVHLMAALLAAIFGAAILIAFVVLALRSKKSPEKSPVQKTQVPVTTPAETSAAPAPAATLPTPPVVVAKPEKNWMERLTQGLSKSRQDIWKKVESLVVGRKLDAQMIEELEEVLYSADLGTKVTQELLQKLETEAGTKELSLEDLKLLLKNFLGQQMSDKAAAPDRTLFEYSSNNKKPYVIMIAGVNGAGKTTTVGKLATRLTRQGAKVVVGACDTFRAAAVDQLAVWCERAGATMIRAKEGSAPSGVGYQALERARAEGADYCLLDTAGRLHTSTDLMEELTKSKRVLAKLMPEAPQQVLLVLDAIAGQNSLRQAHEFNKSLQLTGLIFTKCDGSSKAGSAVGIVKELSLPITYIGVGEGVDDLDRFDQELYLNSLLGINS